MHVKQADFHSVAGSRGGRCLNPTDYVNVTSKLTWECLEGHQWPATWNNVKNGSWCPQCNNKSETFVRWFLEFVSGCSLPSSKPSWLKNCGGPRAYYQLDGLNEAQHLAFEYHGPQHFRQVAAYHRDGHTLERQQARDAFVRDACAARGVRLVEVGPLPNATVEEQVAHIRTCYEAIFGALDEALVRQFLERPFGEPEIAKMRAHATAMDGQCLSKIFTGGRTKYRWRCSAGHEWHATWMHVKEGRWCVACSKSALPSVELLQDAARQRGGRCLNPDSYSRREKLRWRCAQDHEWGATWTSIQQGRWCSTCAWKDVSERFTMPVARLLEHAKSLGGECLTPDAYTGNTMKLQWQCAQGHTWKATWASLQLGHWCPQCARIATAARQRTPVEVLLAKAASLGGKLVDPASYNNAAGPVLWACAEGHTWLARWGDVQRGRWCRECKRAKQLLVTPA